MRKYWFHGRCNAEFLAKLEEDLELPVPSAQQLLLRAWAPWCPERLNLQIRA